VNSPKGISDPHARGGHARHGAKTRERLLVEAASGRLIAAGQAGIDVHHDAALEGEAGIGDGGFHRRPQEHAGGRERDERQRELTHHENVARRKARSAAARHLAA
jgi:hypothetical protein